MNTTSYDGVILGAGQHGLILANYLAKQGLKVLLVERRLHYGGGLTTEEVTAPGFYHNLHSVNHFSISSTPWFRDLGLQTKVNYITPRYEFAQPHLDGSALVFSRDLDETARSISRFSTKDAATFREWNAKAEEMTQRIFLKERFAEPLTKARRAEILNKSTLGSEFLALTEKQPGDVVDELFEDERVKVLFLFKLSLFGTVLHETLGAPSPVGSLIRAFDLTTGYELCEGGSFNLARGLMETYLANGGDYINQAEVEQIVIENGRATGVTFRNRPPVKVHGFVASSLDVKQTFEDLLGTDHLPNDYQQKVSDFKNTDWTLVGVHLALKEAPQYTSADFDPNINGALKYNIGSESLASLNKAHEEVMAGKIPSEIQFGGGALSVLDPKQAPEGKHTAYAWHVAPFAPDGDPENLRAAEAEMTEQILEKWREYAPNMTADNVIASYTYSAIDYSKHLINMRNGDIFMGALTSDQVLYNHFGYRSPVENLYYAGSGAHPNGAISGGVGYITAGLIVRDLGLEPWWTPMDAESELAGLAND